MINAVLEHTVNPVASGVSHAAWGALKGGVKTIAGGMSLAGRGAWHAAGTLAPNRLARAALLGGGTVGAVTQLPQMVGRMSQDAAAVRNVAPFTRGF